jgi:hypothetical protein
MAGGIHYDLTTKLVYFHYSQPYVLLIRLKYCFHLKVLSVYKEATINLTLQAQC